MKSCLHRTEWPLVRELVIRGTTFYQVDPRPRAKRETFSSLTKARTRAAQIAKDQFQFGVQGQFAPIKSRVALAEIESMVAKYGKTLRELMEVGKKAFEEERLQAASLSMSDAVDQWIEHKESAHRQGKLRKRSISNLRPYAREFKGVFGNINVRAMEPKLIAQYESTVIEKPRSTLTRRAILSEFFKFCILHDFRAENPITKLHGLFPVKRTETPIAVLTIEEAQRLMECAQASPEAKMMAPYFAVALFAGLRPESELGRLDWAQIDFTHRPDHPHGRIAILNTNKTAAERWVPISANLKAWLHLYPKKKGPMLRPRRAYERVKIEAGYALQGAEGTPWVEDITRHSFASYWLSAYENKERLAMIHGSDLATIRRYYFRPLPTEEGKAYWEIAP